MSLYDYSKYAEKIETAEAGILLQPNSEELIRFIGLRPIVSNKYDPPRDYLVLKFDFPQQPLAYEAEYLLIAPSSYDYLDAKELNDACVNMRNIAQALGINLSKPVNWEEHIGKECSAKIKPVPSDGNFRPKHSIVKFI